MWGKSEDEKYSSVVKAIEDKKYNNIIKTLCDELYKDLDYNDYNDYEILLLYLLLFDEKLIQPQILKYYEKNHGDYITGLNKKYKNQHKKTNLVYRDIILEHIIIFCKFPSYDYIKNIHYANYFTEVCDKIIKIINKLTIWDDRFKSLMRAFVYCKLGYFYAAQKDNLNSVDNFKLARSEYDKFLSTLQTKDFEAKMYYYSIEKKQTDRLIEDIKYAEENSTDLYNYPAKEELEVEANNPLYEGEFKPEIYREAFPQAVQEPAVQEPAVQEPVVQEPVVQEAPLTAREIRLLEMKKSRTAKKVNEESLVLDTLDALDTFLDAPDTGGRGRRRRTRKNRRSKKVRKTRR